MENIEEIILKNDANKRTLEQIIEPFKTTKDLISSIDDNLITTLLDDNERWDLVENPIYYSMYKGINERERKRYDFIKEGMIRYVNDSEVDGLTRDLQSQKGDFMTDGNTDDDFRRFYFNELFYNDELVDEYLRGI